LFTAPINSTLYSRSLWLCFFSRGLCTERGFFQHPLARSCMHAMYTKENSCSKCVNNLLNMKQVCQVIAPTTLGLLSCQTNLFLITSHPIIGERHLAAGICLRFIQPTHFRKLRRLITFYQDSQGTTRVSYIYLLAFVEMFGINSRTQGSTQCAPPHTSPL
jgi:hypothetical protein